MRADTDAGRRPTDGFRPRLPLWASLTLAVAGALLLQALVSAIVLHRLFFADPAQAALRQALFRAYMAAAGIHPSPLRHALLSPLSTTLLSAIVVGAVSLPIIRGLTARLQRLQRGVQALGDLDLGARVAVEGNDEVAALAGSFNRAAERIEALVQSHRSLLAYTSHELRTPLTRLRLAVETLAGPEDTAARQRAIADARHDIAELDELIGAILLYSRLDADGHVIERREVDLLALAAEEASRGDAEVDGDWVRIQGDERLLRHAVRNLLDNARKHAPGAPAALTVRATPGGGVTLTVRDSGPGVPASEAERIFEPFVRLGATSDGSGLGLPLVRRIARLHGGDARYRPNPGGGACFVIELPPPLGR